MNSLFVTNSIFDVQIIVNISIAVILGIVGANLVSEIISRFIFGGVPSLWKWGINKFLPIRFTVGATTNFKEPYGTNIYFPEGTQSMGVHLLISRKPTLYTFLNKEIRVKVNLIDSTGNLKLSGQKFGHGVWRLAETTLEGNVPYLTHFTVTRLQGGSISDFPISIVIVAGDKNTFYPLVINPSNV